mmetsp:Transcript_18750/g.19024  ORF Transcript_18750/g.19024 Transcript_18750/m.19024 type:complete len:228 (+) Transcript_18750:1-684(+)
MSILSSSSSLSSSPLPDIASVSSATTSAFPTRNTRKLKHFVFREPVVIPPESILGLSIASSALLSKVLMAGMYNLALTLHLHALSLASSLSSSSTATATATRNQPKNKQIKKLFSRSKSLYELVFHMLVDSDDVDDDDDDDVDPLFTLAVTNNLGLIYRIMNDKDRSNVCFQNMFSTMMYLLDSHHENSSSSSSQSSSIKEWIWDGFLSNAMDTLFKHTYEVAAAAA